MCNIKRTYGKSSLKAYEECMPHMNGAGQLRVYIILRGSKGIYIWCHSRGLRSIEMLSAHYTEMREMSCAVFDRYKSYLCDKGVLGRD
jgi:hypothetical protein